MNPLQDSLKTYLQALQNALAAGDATEHTHRPALKTFLEALEPGVTATNEPKQVTDCGKPDLALRRGAVPLLNPIRRQVRPGAFSGCRWWEWRVQGGREMGEKRNTPEQIIGKRRETEVASMARARRPMSSILGLGLKGLTDKCCYLLMVNGAGTAGLGLIVQTGEALMQEAPAPLLRPCDPRG